MGVGREIFFSSFWMTRPKLHRASLEKVPHGLAEVMLMVAISAKLSVLICLTPFSSLLLPWLHLLTEWRHTHPALSSASREPGLRHYLARVLRVESRYKWGHLE